MSSGRCLHPEANAFTSGKNVILGTFNNDRRTSFYWWVDYERDNHGQPVRDGAYILLILTMFIRRMMQLQTGRS